MSEALPLMPGFEKIEPRPELEPTPELYAGVQSSLPAWAAQPRTATPPPIGRNLDEVGGAVLGCSCEHCNAIRSEFYEMQQVATPVPPPLQVFNWSTADPNARRIRGRYDFSQSGDSGLQGRVRWREPGTMAVYDEHGVHQWTYVNEHADGSLSDNQRNRWYPTGV